MAEAYDPSETDERPRSSHLSRKDIRVLGIALLVFCILLLPVYRYLRSNRDRTICKNNLRQMSLAMGTYLEQNNDRYPPAFVVGDKGEPNLFDGHPYTWMSLIKDGMSARYSFNCDSASDSEKIKNLHPDPQKPPFDSAYGLYYAWTSYNSTMVDNPNTAILIAETANHGAENSFDPLAFSHGIDGMVIGWEDNNFKPSPASEHVTRLAFPDTKGGSFKKTGPARHGDVIYALTASGVLASLKPTDARIQRIGQEPTGRWAVR